MKRILSLLLAVMMLVSAVPAAYATNIYQSGDTESATTQVVYTADNNEDWTVTVPAKLNPGQSGTVTLAGDWPDSKTISVTADKTVTLTNSIKATDTKTLNVNFDGISEKGSNIAAQTFTESVSVDPIEAALFGTWNGKFNYNVESSVEEMEPVTPPEACVHTNTIIKDAVDAACFVDGYTGDTWCLDCGRRVSIGDVIPAGHINTTIRDNYDATCVDDGYTGDIWCLDCGRRISIGDVIPAGHIDNNNDGICDNCGEAESQVEMATLTLTITDTNVSSVYVNGEEVEESTTMEVPVGTIVECYTSVESSSDRNLAYLSINGVKTYHSEGDGFYPEYIVVGDATINCGYEYGSDKYGYIEITEAGAGPEMVTVTVNEIDTEYAELCDSNGNILYGGTYQFPVGTVLQCWISDYSHDSDYDGVYLNGASVAYASENSTITYDYVLTQNVTIVVGADTKGYEEGRIEITEG